MYYKVCVAITYSYNYINQTLVYSLYSSLLKPLASLFQYIRLKLPSAAIFTTSFLIVARYRVQQCFSHAHAYRWVEVLASSQQWLFWSTWHFMPTYTNCVTSFSLCHLLTFVAWRSNFVSDMRVIKKHEGGCAPQAPGNSQFLYRIVMSISLSPDV